MLTDWIEVSTNVSETLESSSIWDRSWYRKCEWGAAMVNRRPAYILRVAPWYPDVELRGKIFIYADGGGFTINQAPKIPGTTVPHVFDNLEEAQAVYDLIVDKE